MYRQLTGRRRHCLAWASGGCQVGECVLASGRDLTGTSRGGNWQRRAGGRVLEAERVPDDGSEAADLFIYFI